MAANTTTSAPTANATTFAPTANITLAPTISTINTTEKFCTVATNASLYEPSSFASCCEEELSRFPPYVKCREDFNVCQPLLPSAPTKDQCATLSSCQKKFQLCLERIVQAAASHVELCPWPGSFISGQVDLREHNGNFTASSLHSDCNKSVQSALSSSGCAEHLSASIDTTCSRSSSQASNAARSNAASAVRTDAVTAAIPAAKEASKKATVSGIVDVFSTGANCSRCQVASRETDSCNCPSGSVRVSFEHPSSLIASVPPSSTPNCAMSKRSTSFCIQGELPQCWGACDPTADSTIPVRRQQAPASSPSSSSSSHHIASVHLERKEGTAYRCHSPNSGSSRCMCPLETDRRASSMLLWNISVKSYPGV